MGKIRGKRNKPMPIVLTERDIDILSLLGLVKYLSIPQLHREFFPSIDRTRRRIRQLFDNKLVNITLAGSNRPSLVSLSREGLNLLTTRRPELAERVRLPKAVRLASVEHRLAINDLRLYVASWCRQNNLSFIRWSNAGGELQDIGFDDIHLEPDGCFEIRGKQVVRIAGEIDCQTEGQRVLANKFKKYALAFNEGLLNELWIVITTNNKTRENIFIRLAENYGLSKSVRVFQLDYISERPVNKLVKTVAEVLRFTKTVKTSQNESGYNK